MKKYVHFTLNESQAELLHKLIKEAIVQILMESNKVPWNTDRDKKMAELGKKISELQHLQESIQSPINMQER